MQLLAHLSCPPLCTHCVGARSEGLASALLELHGLQDMLDKLWGWVSEAEATIKETELVPIGNNLEAVEQQLTEHEVSLSVYSE